MPDDPTTPPPPHVEEPPDQSPMVEPPVDPVEVRAWIEVAVVMALMWLPSMFQSVASYAWPVDAPPPSFAYDMLAQIVNAVQVAAPVAYLMWRGGKGWAFFGVKRVQPILDVSAAVAIMIVAWIVSILYWRVFGSMYVEMMSTASRPPTETMFARPRSAAEFVLLIAGCTAIGIHEEVAVRGFLLPHLEVLLKSPTKAVVLTALIFASYHMYQQPLETGLVFTYGLVLGAAFCVLRRLWPLILAHAATDLCWYLGLG